MRKQTHFLNSLRLEFKTEIVKYLLNCNMGDAMEAALKSIIYMATRITFLVLKSDLSSLLGPLMAPQVP